MNNNVTYNVKTTINSETQDEKELVGLFNTKLLKLIFSLENDKNNIK